MEENDAGERQEKETEEGATGTIVTVSELIDNTFGDSDENRVHHKQLQAVLYLLSSQLKLLERKVAVKLKPPYLQRHSSSSISVTEVRLQVGKAGSKTKLDGRGGYGAKKDQKGTRGKDTQAASFEPTSSDKTSKGEEGGGVDRQSAKSKVTSDKTSSGGGTSEKASTGVTTRDKISIDLTSSSDKKSGKKSESGKGSAGKSYGDETITTSDITSAVEKSSTGEKSSTAEKSKTRDKTSSKKKSSPGDEFSDDEESTAGGKTSKGSKTSSGGKSSPGDKAIDDEESISRGKSSKSDKTSASGKSSARDKKSVASKSSPGDESSSDEESEDGDKTSAGVKSSKRDKTSAGGKSSSDKTSTGRSAKSSHSDKTSTGRTATDRTSTADEISISDDAAGGSKTALMRTASDRTYSSKSTTDKISGKSTTDKSGKPPKKTTGTSVTGGRKPDPQEYQRILDEVEEMRERELRVIRQRADSREEREKTPTPIASMDSVEATYEKLLVVERLPTEEAAARAARMKSGAAGAGPRISVVTLEQFKALASTVHQLQQKFLPVGSSAFPENIELMAELRKGASLTDAMAALQLSARLEATEKTLTNLLSLVTDMATQMPGFKPSRAKKDDIEVLFGAGAGAGAGTGAGAGAKDDKQQQGDVKGGKGVMGKGLTDIAVSPLGSGSGTSIMVPPVIGSATDDIEMKHGDMVTYDELERKLRDVEKDIMKKVTTATERSTADADAAKKLIGKLEQRLETAMALGNRMDDLENLVSNYAEQINILDTGLSSQLTNYQEELTQMQHDLETGLENMAEVLANTGGDATAVAELNGHFNDLQIDIDDAVQRQIDLRQIQYGLSTDLNGLRRQIEMLRDAKSDRDEVTDALRDKAGLSDLNGLISIQQFEAVIGDLEKRLAAAHDKFNNQEIVWQKAIDEVLRELNEKADVIQVDNLREQINHYLELLRKRMQFIMDIVGEPVAAALVKKINRGGACLSCSAPAYMELEQTTVPSLPAMRSQAVDAEAPKGDGDHGVCYPGLPIRHPIDPRAHICHRWCGGSHTRIDNTQSRVPPGLTITPLNREVALAQGTDGKMYVVDKERDPCAQCLPHVPPSPSSVSPPASVSTEEVDYKKVAEPSSSVSLELLPALSTTEAAKEENATPPLIDMDLRLQSSLCIK